MKKSLIQTNVLFLLLLGVSIFSGTLFAQPYLPVCHENSTTWRYFIQGLDYISDLELLVGDKVGDSYSISSKEGDYIEELGVVRENSESGKIWFKANYSGAIEYLIMDLSLEVGDEFEFQGINNYPSGEVTEIWIDSENRKHIKFNVPTPYFDDSVEFIEGVGPNIGVVYTEIGVGLVSCKFDFEEQVYQIDNPNFIGCELDHTGISNLEKVGLKLYPNPVTGTSKISTTSNTYICDYQIINALGVVCEKGTRISTSDITLDRSKFIPGIYLLTTRCCENEKQTAVKFIVK